MKKALAMALGAMLAAGSALPAAAASQIDFSGFYRVYFQNDYRFANVTNAGVFRGEQETDSYFVNRLNLDFGFHATDEVSVYWRLRAPHGQYWGQGNGQRTAAQTLFVYGRVKQDWGTIDIGRLPSTYLNIGLKSLGWYPLGPDPVAYTAVNPFDLDTEYDGIRYSNRWDNGFQLVAQYNRLNYAGRDADGFINNVGANDVNRDLFILEPAFFWDGGGASVAFLYERDARTKFNAANEGAFNAWYINPAFSQTWGDFSLHFEGKAGWGQQDRVGGGDRDRDGLGLFLDLNYNYGPGSVNLAGWWTQGTGDNANDDHSLIDMGKYYALLVAYNSDVSGRGRYANYGAVAVANLISGDGFNNAANRAANHWAIDLNGSHAFTDDLSLTYAVAYLALNKTREHAKKDIGVETDLGLQIQLLDNLKFTTSVGYLFAGKALDGYQGIDPGLGIPANFQAKDAYTWYTTLTFSF